MSDTPTWQVVWESDERIVAMVQYRDFIVVATERRIYRSLYDPLTNSMKFRKVLIEQKP